MPRMMGYHRLPSRPCARPPSAGCDSWARTLLVLAQLQLPSLLYRLLPCRATAGLMLASMCDEPQAEEPVLENVKLAFRCGCGSVSMAGIPPAPRMHPFRLMQQVYDISLCLICVDPGSPFLWSSCYQRGWTATGRTQHRNRHRPGKTSLGSRCQYLFLCTKATLAPPALHHEPPYRHVRYFPEPPRKATAAQLRRLGSAAPVLVVCAERDMFGPGGGTAALARQEIPGCETVLLPGMRHVPSAASMRQVTQLLLDFFIRHGLLTA
jgi:hypothetical protein